MIGMVALTARIERQSTKTNTNPKKDSVTGEEAAHDVSSASDLHIDSTQVPWLGPDIFPESKAGERG
jgi:hypothetical protein